MFPSSLRQRLGEATRSLWPPVAVSGVALLVYVATMPPGLSFGHHSADGGDLIAAAANLGVPHPPGYPTYTLLAWLALRLPFGSLAFRVGLLSVLCAAAAVGFLCLTATHVLPDHKHRPILAASTAMTLAFSSLFWSQAVVAEVYALLALCAGLLFYLLVRWAQMPKDSLLWLAALVAGLGLGNHPTLLLMFPPALLWLWPRRRLWLRVSALLPACGFLVAGLAVYAYLPLAAAHHPPVNWGHPQTWPRFVWMATARAYRPLPFGLDLHSIAGRLSRWALSMGSQFAWWGLAAAAAGAAIWWKRDRRLAAFGLTWTLVVSVYAFFYATDDSQVYLVPVMLVAALCWGHGACILLDQLSGLRRSWRHLALACVGLSPVGLLALHWQTADLSHDVSGDAFIAEVLGGVAPAGLILVQSDRPTFALWYGLYAEKQRPDVTVVSGPLLAYSWYRESLRQTYPHLAVPEPGSSVLAGDVVRELVVRNYSGHPIYATDPADDWAQWSDRVQQQETPLFRIYPKLKWESHG